MAGPIVAPTQQERPCPGPGLNLFHMESKKSEERNALISCLVISIFATILFLGITLALIAAPLWAPLMLGVIAGGGLISAVVFGVLLANFDKKLKEEKERTNPDLRCNHCKCFCCDFGMKYIEVSDEEFSTIVRERLTHFNASPDTIESLLPIYISVKKGKAYADSDSEFLDEGDLKSMVRGELLSLSAAYKEHYPKPGKVTFTSAMSVLTS